MLRVGEALGRFLWLGGWSGRLVLAAGLAGIALSLASALSLAAPSWRSAARRIGSITLLVAAATMALAAATTWMGRAKADDLARAADLAPRRERLQHDGYIEARVPSLGGLLLGAFPLIAGTAALMAGSSRRSARDPSPSPTAPVAAGRPRSRPPRARASLIGLSSWPVLAALTCALLAAAGARAEIPGRDLDKLAWDLLEHEAQIQAGRLDEGCPAFARDLQALGPAEAASIVRDLKALEDACARSRGQR